MGACYKRQRNAMEERVWNIINEGDGAFYGHSLTSLEDSLGNMAVRYYSARLSDASKFDLTWGSDGESIDLL